MTDALAPRAVFFLHGPVVLLLSWIPHGHSWLWWVAVILGAWFGLSILFAIWWALGGAEKTFGPRQDEDDEA